jgi:hypothetical protein
MIHGREKKKESALQLHSALRGTDGVAKAAAVEVAVDPLLSHWSIAAALLPGTAPPRITPRQIPKRHDVVVFSCCYINGFPMMLGDRPLDRGFSTH